MKPRLYLFLLAAIIFISPSAFSQNVITPIKNPPGSFAAWSVASNWSGNNIANLITEDADFSGNNKGNVVVPDGYSVSVGNVDIQIGNTFTIAPTGTMDIGAAGNGNERDLIAKNNGLITVAGDLTIWGNLLVMESLNLIVTGDLIIQNNMVLDNNATVFVSGLIDVGGNINLGNNANLILSSGGSVILGGSCTEGNGSSFCTLIPLPVELLDFEARAAKNQVELVWSTAAEIDNDFFTLEKSKNGLDFTEIGKVTGNGTTNIVSKYSFADKSPHLGLSYYRLSQTDYDGTTEIFPAVSVVALSQHAAFSVSPNPVSNSFAKLKVSHRDRNELLELNIIDLQGKLVQKRVLKTDDFGNVETEIELKSQSRRGTYIFELVSKNNREYLKVTSN